MEWEIDGEGIGGVIIVFYWLFQLSLLGYYIGSLGKATEEIQSIFNYIFNANTLPPLWMILVKYMIVLLNYPFLRNKPVDWPYLDQCIKLGLFLRSFSLL